MAITVYGRKSIRAVERETGRRIVHAAGPWATTIEHQHLRWDLALDLWVPAGSCALDDPASPIRLSSCRTLFGRDKDHRRRCFMLGACDQCDAGPAEQHQWDCPVLLDLLEWRSINPDYWPRPVHRPLWVDDRRRTSRIARLLSPSRLPSRP